MLSNLTTPTKNNKNNNTSNTSDYCDNLERMIVETPPMIHQSPSTDISTIGGVESNMGDNDTGYDTYTDDVDDEELAYGNIDTTNDISYNDMHLDNTMPLENNTPRATNDNGLPASGAAAAAADPPGEHGIGLNGSGIWSPDLQWSPQPKMLHPNLSPSGLSPLRTADNDVELAAAQDQQRSRSSSPTNTHNGVKDAAYRHDIMHNNNNTQQQHQYAAMPEHTLSVPESNDALNDTLNSQSTSGGGLFRPQSRLVKVLCIGSIFLVVAALGLAATGLTMMYTADKNQEEQVYGNEAVIDGAELPRVDNGPSQEQWDILDNSQFDFNIGENGWDGDDEDEDDEGIDQAEFVIDEEDGPKTKMTEEPTSPPSLDSIEEEEESDETEPPELEIGQGWATEPPVEVPEDEPDTWECRRNGQCAEDGSELCLLDTGDCTGKAGSGVCVGLFQYEDCTDDITPVCGCDGVDYSNECNAHAAGVSVSHTGLCSSVEKIDPLPTTSPTSPGEKCRFDEQCEVSEFCLFEIDNCLGKRGFGECVPSANFEMCNDLYDPVCGCDGEDYTNSCKANSAGVSVASMGSCSAAADVTESTTEASEPNVLVPGTLLLHSLPAIADTFLEFNETEAFGMRGRLKVDADIERISLLKFDLSSLANVTRTSEIVGMSLKLFSLTDSPHGGKIDLIDDVCNDWTESYITWNNAPECFFQNYTIPSGEFENNILAYEWNEAVLFPDFDFDTVLPDFITLRVTSTYANGVTYASRENATAVPQLVVYYTLPVPTVTPTSSAPTVFVSKAPTKSPAPSIELPPTEVPTKIPSWSPTGWPTYYPTSTPTRNATSPSSAPTETPKTIIIPASQDAMVRAGEFSDNRYGKDPFIAMQGQRRKAIIEFDLSEVKPSFEYQYYLQFFVTYVASNNARAVTASYITQQDFTWDEETISWNSMGEPTEEEIGWFSIFKNDENKMVEIPIGNLFNSTVSGNRFILSLTNSAIDTGGDKFDFRSTEFSERFDSLSDSPPTLKAVPQFEEEEEEEEEVFAVPQVEEEEVL